MDPTVCDKLEAGILITWAARHKLDGRRSKIQWVMRYDYLDHGSICPRLNHPFILTKVKTFFWTNKMVLVQIVFFSVVWNYWAWPISIRTASISTLFMSIHPTDRIFGRGWMEVGPTRSINPFYIMKATHQPHILWDGPGSALFLFRGAGLGPTAYGRSRA